MVDLSGVIGDRLENTLAKARKLVEQGALQKAAIAYAQAAKLMKKYAQSATSSEIRKKRLADASKLQSYAEQLRQGKVPSAQGENPDIAVDRDITTEEDDYTENAKDLITQAKVSWDEIAGLDDVKRFVKESYALSLAQRPDGVGLPRVANLLLYGPPGTGKTLIAAAISKGLEATFFSCKVSDMLSKYFGESSKLIKYFLAALTTPENEMWVNLSPYEKDRIIPDAFGITEMGRDLLAQDYILKQITSSLMYPEDELGSRFWDKVYAAAYEKFGSVDIPPTPLTRSGSSRKTPWSTSTKRPLRHMWWRAG